MKKITFGNTYKALEEVTPPIILKSFKKTAGYRRISRSLKRRLKGDYSPSWHAIQAGALKGKWLYIDSTDEWQKEMISGRYDDFFFEFMEKIDLRGKTVFDVGAHIGFSTLYFADKVGPQGKVIAFEPNALNIERMNMILAKNGDLTKRVVILPKAVSDTEGKTIFRTSATIDDGSSSGGFIDAAHTFHEKDSYEKSRGFRQTVVETTTLDHIFSGQTGQTSQNSQNYGIPYLLKIDIEGAEYAALMGGKAFLKKHRPILLMEIHSIFNMFKVGEFLQELGYGTVLLKEEKDGRCFIAAQAK